MGPPEAPSPGVQGSREFALFDVCARQLGVSTDQVVQAVAYPQAVTRLPRLGGNALEGVFMHRGQLVPLVDLRRWMGADDVLHDGDQRRGAERQVLILQGGGRVIAVLIDSLGGLLRVRSEDVRRCTTMPTRSSCSTRWRWPRTAAR